MSEQELPPFNYTQEPHTRIHGPDGYTDYRSYKPWLRDEFEFRCVFCLYRERWSHDGDSGFGVEHFRSKSKFPELICRYDNLLLACMGCNSAKQDSELGLDPCVIGLAKHIRVQEDGHVSALSDQGADLIGICDLDRPTLVEYRERMLMLWRDLRDREDDCGRELLRRHFGYPDILPCLKELRPPGGNVRPDGIYHCHFERQLRRELEVTY